MGLEGLPVEGGQRVVHVVDPIGKDISQSPELWSEVLLMVTLVPRLYSGQYSPRRKEWKMAGS